MSNTRGMTRREKMQYEARIRNMTGTSKLHKVTEAYQVIEDDKLIDDLLRKNTKGAKWAEGAAYSEEFMYGTDEENTADWVNSGVVDTAIDTTNEEYYG